MSKYSSLTQASLPYAEALFESSQVMKLIDQTSQDLILITKTVKESKQLEDFLANPLIVAKVKKEVLKSLFYNQVSRHVFNFLCILIERRRISLLNSIAESYFNLVYQLELTTIVNIYSAVVLTDLQKDSIEKKLQVMTGSQSVELIVKINPDLIGGLVVKIGSKVIDMSISGQLNQIAAYLNVSRV